MIGIDYSAEANAIKRTAGALKRIAPDVRRFARVKSAAERRSKRLEVAAELAGIGGRFFSLAAGIIGDREDDPKMAKVQDQLRAAARTVVGKGK